MPIVLSPSMLFPPLSWWGEILRYDEVLLSGSEPFRKMSWRNRYRIATANGPLLLSVPVMGGRTSKVAAEAVMIDYKQDWQKQHWRSLFSAYGRAPFFEYYGPALNALIHQNSEHLMTFNLAALEWIKKELRLKVVFRKEPVDGDGDDEAGVAKDLMQETFGVEEGMVRYGQVFEDRHGFLANLSILDLLMNEGPAAAGILLAK